MRWIDGVEYRDGRLVTSHVDDKGNRDTGSLVSLRSNLPPRGYEVAHESGVSLASLEPTDPSTYLEGIGMPQARRDGHEVFRMYASQREMLIPAGVLLLALLGAPGLVGKHLLRPASLDQLAIASEAGSDPTAHLLLPPSLEAQFGTNMRSRMTWLTRYPSARQFWESVYLKGTQGSLGCRLPKARVEARFFAISSGRKVLVSRMAVRSLAPQEEAFDFARDGAPQLFDFTDERSLSSAATLAAYRSANNIPELKRQVDIPEGKLGWMMTDDEWITVRQRLAKMGFSCRDDALAAVNAALEKHGSGQTWASLWVTKGSSSTYSEWLKDGRWAALKKVLHEIRSP